MPRRSRETGRQLPLVLRGTGLGQDPVTLDRLRKRGKDGGFRDDEGAEGGAIRPTGSSASEPSHEAAVEDVQNLRSESLGLSRDKSPNVVTIFGREAARSVFVVKPPGYCETTHGKLGWQSSRHSQYPNTRANAAKPAIAHYGDTTSRIQPRH